jgi:ubiquinone/menaquinone biosynthesis C-methylase UbiE
MKKSIFINLEDLKLQGNVLDISLKGCNVVPRLLKLQENEEEALQTDYIRWDSGVIPTEDSQFDTGIAMFSLGRAAGRHKTVRIIKEVSRVLKHGGSIIIWDVNSKITMPLTFIDIKALLPDRNVLTIPGKAYLNMFSPGFESIIKILENNNFVIRSSKINGSIYKIEAENMK